MLNEQQREVVYHRGSPLVCFAAAGTGKTQALTCRIASLIKDDGVDPKKIVALTFTTKAANEMKERAARIANVSKHDLRYVSTFHSFCLKVLRKFSSNKIFRQLASMECIEDKNENNNNESFTVIDPRASYKMMKIILAINRHCVETLAKIDRDFGAKKNNIDDQVQYVLHAIDKWRNEGWLPDDVESHLNATNDHGGSRQILHLYKAYRAECGITNGIDFSDMILLTTRLLEMDKGLCLYCRSEMFEVLLVDEFQDVCPSQMNLIDVLCRSRRDAKNLRETGNEGIYTPKLVEDNLMVVGDDYQAIHEWRGACVKKILEFEKSFDNVKSVILVKNYRSYEAILDAATNVIRHNKHQKHKVLECQRMNANEEKGENENENEGGYGDGDGDGGMGGEGDEDMIGGEECNEECNKDSDSSGDNNSNSEKNRIITHKICGDQFFEAQSVVEAIQRYTSEKTHKFSDCVILYRTHTLSQPLEERLKAAHIPYTIKGSMSFFDRAEVAFALRCLKFLHTKGDDALENILVTCVRNVGMAKVNAIREEMMDEKDARSQGLWRALCDFVEKTPDSKSIRIQQTYHALKKCVGILKDAMRRLSRDEDCDCDCDYDNQNDGSRCMIAEVLKDLLESLGYLDILEAKRNKNNDDQSDQNQNDCMENLGTLFAFIKKSQSDRGGHLSLSDLFDIIMLDSCDSDAKADDDGNGTKEEEKENRVTLMTLHSSKGLEWPFVSIVGCNEDTIPYYRGNIEEERRLFYVGLTRARDKLLLTYPQKRRLFNKTMASKASRFWKEMYR